MATHDAIVEAFNNYLSESENFEEKNVKASVKTRKRSVLCRKYIRLGQEVSVNLWPPRPTGPQISWSP